MNKGQKVLAGLLGVVAAELAVLDYAAFVLMKNGITIEVDGVEKLDDARQVVESELAAEGEEMIEEAEL